MCRILGFTLLIFAFNLSAQVRFSTTIYPFKAILQEITGTRAEIDVLLPPAADPHTFELTTSDIKKVLKSKALFYGSEGLDEWAANVEGVKKIELIKFVPAGYLLKIHTNDNEDYGTDPHFWTDPLTVKSIIPSLLNQLIKLDPEGKDIYKKNAEKFSSNLSELDKQIRDKLSSLNNTNVFLSHPFFNYFLKRYGINAAGFVEISPGHQSTPGDIKKLIDISKKKNVKVIFNIAAHPERTAKVFAETAGIKMVDLDPNGGIKGRYSYEEIILYNTEIIFNSLK